MLKPTMLFMSLLSRRIPVIVDLTSILSSICKKRKINVFCSLRIFCLCVVVEKMFALLNNFADLVQFHSVQLALKGGVGFVSFAIIVILRVLKHKFKRSQYNFHSDFTPFLVVTKP
jgi:type III secretory pathway component EscT